MRNSIYRAVLVAASLSLVAACGESSQESDSAGADYPERAIEFVVPFNAGGATDIAARMLAEDISDEYDTPVNVVNRPGANQVTGVQNVLNAQSDGHTLLADGAGSSSLQSLLEDVPYSWDDRTFVARVLVGPHAYAVGPSSQAEDLAGLIDEAKSAGSEFRVAWLGGSSTSDFALLQLLDHAGIDPTTVKRVPFQSSGEVMTAVAAGDVDLAVGGASATFSLAGSGDPKVLAVTSDERVSELPDVPTTQEAGVPELDIVYWVGVSGPAEMPEAVVSKLGETIQDLAETPEFVEGAESIAMTPSVLTGEEFAEYVNDEAGIFAELSAQLQE